MNIKSSLINFKYSYLILIIIPAFILQACHFYKTVNIPKDSIADIYTTGKAEMTLLKSSDKKIFLHYQTDYYFIKDVKADSLKITGIIDSVKPDHYYTLQSKKEAIIKENDILKEVHIYLNNPEGFQVGYSEIPLNNIIEIRKIEFNLSKPLTIFTTITATVMVTTLILFLTSGYI